MKKKLTVLAVSMITSKGLAPPVEPIKPIGIILFIAQWVTVISVGVITYYVTRKLWKRRRKKVKT